MFSADPAQMEPLLDHLQERYGSVDAYVAGLGAGPGAARARCGRRCSSRSPSRLPPRHADVGPQPVDGRRPGPGRAAVMPPESCVREGQAHRVPADVDVGVVVGRLGGGADRVDEGQGGGEVVQLDRRDELVALAGPVRCCCSASAASTSAGVSTGSLTGGSSPRGARRRRTPRRSGSPSASAASRSVVPSLCAFLATFGRVVVADDRVERGDQHQRVGRGAAGSAAWSGCEPLDAELAEAAAGVGHQRDRLQDVVDDDRLADVELEVAPAAGRWPPRRRCRAPGCRP